MTAVRPSSGAFGSQRPRSAPVPDLMVHNLGSGSSGNAVLIVAGGTSLLIDCGVERRALLARLAALGCAPATVAGVLVSHEHGDHARSLPMMVDAGIPIVASEGSLNALALRGNGVDRIGPSREVALAGFQVSGLPVAHDARQPLGFTVAVNGRRITVLTDLGSTDGSLVEAVRESDLVVIEANHDADLLLRGPYPPHLKRRILSPRGHLSNADCAAFLGIALTETRHAPTIWLAHLSRTNNRAALARQTVGAALARAGVAAPVVALGRHGGQTWHAEPVPPLQLRLPW